MKNGSVILLFILSCSFSYAQQDSMKVVDRLTIGMTLNDIKEEYPDAILRKVDGWKYNVDGGGYGTEILINDEIHFYAAASFIVLP